LDIRVICQKIVNRHSDIYIYIYIERERERERERETERENEKTEALGEY